MQDSEPAYVATSNSTPRLSRNFTPLLQGSSPLCRRYHQYSPPARLMRITSSQAAPVGAFSHGLFFLIINISHRLHVSNLQRISIFRTVFCACSVRRDRVPLTLLMAPIDRKAQQRTSSLRVPLGSSCYWSRWLHIPSERKAMVRSSDRPVRRCVICDTAI